MNISAFIKNALMGRICVPQCVIVTLLLITGSSAASDFGSSENNPFDNLSGENLLHLGVRDAIFIALEHNPTVTIERLNPEITHTRADELRADFDPEISVTADQNHVKYQRHYGYVKEPANINSTRENYYLEISETLPTGTSVSAEVFMTGSVNNLYTDQYTGGFGLTITQSLLQGFGLKANLADLRKAKLDVEITKAELKAVAEHVIAEVEKAYWNLYLTIEEIAIREKSLELANRQLQESLERVEVGKLPELELAAVHAEVAARRGELIDTWSRHEQARLRLLYLMNPSDDNPWSIKPVLSDKPFLPEDTLDVISTHEELGLKYRPDLEQAKLEVRKGEIELVRTKNGLLPRLDVFITLGRTAYAMEFRDAYPDPTSRFYNASAVIVFAYPVKNRKARAQVVRAQRSKDQMEQSIKNMERLVHMDVRSAYIEVVRSREQIEATRVTRTLQERNLEAEHTKFRVGKSTNYLVLQAQRDFIASQLDEARSMVSYLKALIDLYVMEGTLLDRRSINSPSN
ncbi:TolC family protein [Candidatus Omnitrophota bacterium]